MYLKNREPRNGEEGRSAASCARRDHTLWRHIASHAHIETSTI